MKKKDYLIACLSFVLTFCVGVGVMGCKDGKETTNQNTGTNTNEQGALVGGIVGGLISGIVNGNNVSNNNNNNQTPPNQTPPDETPALPQEGPLVLDESQNLVFNDGLKESGEEGVIQAINGASVSLSGAGSVIAEEENGKAIAVWANGANITIQSGAYGQLVSGLQEEYPLIYASNGGNVYIAGGTFKSATPASTLVCEQGASIIVTGGKFYQYDPSTQAAIAYSINMMPIESGIIVPIGYEVITEGNWCIVQEDAFYEDAQGVVHIRNAEGLLEFADSINIDGETYNDRTIVLDDNIDLAGINWTPINIWDPENYTTMTIDGQGNRISNLTVDTGSKAGFFGGIARNITMKNVVFDNASITTSGSFAGVVIGHQYGNVCLDNVSVVSSSVQSTDEKGIRIGGLIGYSLLHDGATLCLNNNKVLKTQIDGYHNIGGLVGTLYDYDDLTNKWTMVGNTVENCIFNVGDVSEKSSKYVSAFAAEGAQWPYIYEQSNEYFVAKGNEEKNNTVNASFYVDTQGISHINNLAGLMYFAESVNEGGKTYDDKTIVLESNIDLAGVNWTPINLWDPENSATITIDGQGYTISNMKIESTEGYVGFIGTNARNLTIKNLKFDGASLPNVGNFAGVVIGYQYGNVTLSAVTVKNSNIVSRGIRVGGLVGFSVLGDGAKISVNSCVVSNCSIKAIHNVAGFVGTLQDYDTNTDKWEMKGNKVVNCTFEVTSTSAANRKYVSAFAVEGANYPHTYEQSHTYFSGNKQSRNTFKFPN